MFPGNRLHGRWIITTRSGFARVGHRDVVLAVGRNFRWRAFEIFAHEWGEQHGDSAQVPCLDDVAFEIVIEGSRDGAVRVVAGKGQVQGTVGIGELLLVVVAEHDEDQGWRASSLRGSQAGLHRVPTTDLVVEAARAATAIRQGVVYLHVGTEELV